MKIERFIATHTKYGFDTEMCRKTEVIMVVFEF